MDNETNVETEPRRSIRRSELRNSRYNFALGAETIHEEAKPPRTPAIIINYAPNVSSGVTRSSTVLHHPADTAYTPFGLRRSHRSIGSVDELSRPKSIIKRLSSLKSPDLRAGLPFSPRQSRYSAIHELEDWGESEPTNVDISFLEGPNSTFSLAQPISDRDGQKSGGEVVLAEVSVRRDSDPEASSKSSAMLTVDCMTEDLARAASIRDYGQKLARRSNMIVAIKDLSPSVDITSLEGGNRSSAVFETLDQACQSYFYPTDPEQPNWKPLSMRTPYIIMLVVVSLVLAGVEEYLCQKSRSLEKEGKGLIQYNTVADIPVIEFFCWKYLPTMVMVSYGVLWQITDYEVKRLEPYFQLSRPGGNTAAQSLNLDYVTQWTYLTPIKAFYYRQWAVFVACIGSILATAAAPSLQSPTIAPVRNPLCTGSQDDTDCTFEYFVRISLVWSRLLTACLIIVALLGIVLMVQLRRKSGLLSDPRGIAGVAAMATKSHILADFQGMDEATTDEIHQRLRHRRYILHKSTIWQGEYMRQSEHDPYAERKATNPHPIILRSHSLLALVGFLFVVLPFVPVITYTNLNVIPQNLPWLPVLVATLIKQLWTTLEFAVKMIEPFHTLYRGNARPEVTLTLDYQGTPYGLLPLKAAWNRHYLVALVGLGSVLGDILTVTASSLALTNETYKSFTASSGISITIILLLIVSALAVYAHRRHTFLPRQPSTIASVLAFIHQSRMLDDFVGTERYTNKEMEAVLVAKNKRYALGWFKGRDSQPHCAVDEEPMLSRYKHGVSYLQAQAPWVENV